MIRYAWSAETELPLDAAVERVTALLAQQGFGILTRIDVHDVLARKLGVKREPYVILGACNPEFAHRALEAEPAIGILLPCNVVVESRTGGTRVWVTRPDALFDLADRPDLAPLAEAVTVRVAATPADTDALWACLG